MKYFRLTADSISLKMDIYVDFPIYHEFYDALRVPTFAK